MANVQANMTGARLSFVVVPQEGTVRRAVSKWDKRSKQVRNRYG